MNIVLARYFLAGFLFLIPGFALSLEPPLTFADCADIADDRRRLACFDRIAVGSVIETKRNPGGDTGGETSAPAEQPVPPLATGTKKKAAFSLARNWELTPEYKRGTFMFSPYNDNYILFANYSSSPNSTPSSPTIGQASQNNNLSSTEVRFQLSFKMKLYEDVVYTPAALWFGYTQETNWQAYNRKASSPVRETDYQPELMLVIPIDFNVGMRARFFNLGLVHQSNGRSEPLSRSWNRVYAQIGMEKNKFTLTGRVWKQLNENGNDDNPDITDYMGYGDVVVTYRSGEHIFSLLARDNINTGKGAAKMGWEFPLVKNLRGYAELFSGYGHSLIDYNHYQTTAGLGLLLNF